MIKVSVCMITYNHEKYIEQAIKSVLSQKTYFPIELIIGDDCSTDNTRKIIAKYRRKYPKKIFLIKRIKNIGMMNNFVDTLNKCKGKYIALCEGDDYWIDDRKLQKQVDFLEKHPKCSICTHNVYVVNEETGKKHEWLGKNHRKTSAIKDILKYGSGGATCSIVLRSNVVRNLPKWFKTLPSGDWPLQILACKTGDMNYLTKPMAVYRRHDKGSTSATNLKDMVRIYDSGGINLCNIFDKHLKYKYSDEIDYNLVNYFYPQLFKAFRKVGDKKKTGYYASLMLKNRNLLNFQQKLMYGYYSLLGDF